MTDLTHNPDRYPHNSGNADIDLLCRACEMGVPVKRAMPGPPEHDRYARPHRTFAEDYCYACWAPGWVPPKHLTDAEAAAEYWRAEANFLMDLHGYEYEGDPVPAGHNFVKWLETCVRFDTLPHALEVGA